MKRNILARAAAGAIALGGFVDVQAQAGPSGADQEAKVQPILDQAKPQIVAIHQEAMQKMHTVMNSTLSQIRPMLTADQQSKLDAIEKAHQDMLNARKQLHDAIQD